MANYVRRGGLDVSPPPWRCDDIHATIFYVQADSRKLQALCDRTLNQPSGPDPAHPELTRLKFKPTVSWVALTFQRFEKMRSTAPLDPGSLVRESHSYGEASFWVMVEDQVGVRLLIPYMFIDDGICCAAGREIYGFPKEYGSIDIPDAGDPQPARFSIKALAVTSGATDAQNQTILECVRRRSGRPSYLLGPQDPTIVPPDAAITAMTALYKLLVSGALDFVFLRQFRALGGGTGADLQQVTTAQASPFKLTSIRILLDYELLLPRLSSHMISADLGFAVAPVAVPFGLQCRLAFTLNGGKIL